MYFFVPKLLIRQGLNSEIQIFISDLNQEYLAKMFLDFLSFSKKNELKNSPLKNQIFTRLPKDYYLKSVENIKNHIKIGDVYELNFCQEFYCNDAKINPFQTYLKLNAISEMPFSSFFKLDDIFLMCASPERYLQKTGTKIISQPIKGTSRRFDDSKEDELSKTELRNNQKEVSENVMIVDLVRNDLSRTASPKSVKVEEFCKVYSFPKVHQMISTISSELAPKYSWTDVLKTTFPMGSMTGAPKVKAMELIEKYEKTKRGLYSGSVGYVTPDGDFDFNVVIRSIQYNQSKKSLSFITGSAITILSDAEKEYEECLLKAQAIFEILG
jgi:para-aminobenzoate synthetase component 1